jgi:hypothetical protein
VLLVVSTLLLVERAGATTDALVESRARMTDNSVPEGDSLAGRLGGTEVKLTVGSAARVWNHSLDRWTAGFAVAEVVPGGYRLRRLSDGHVFRDVFSIPSSRGRPSSRWGQSRADLLVSDSEAALDGVSARSMAQSLGRVDDLHGCACLSGGTSAP